MQLIISDYEICVASADLYVQVENRVSCSMLMNGRKCCW
jgi:hypothetical protein